MKNIFTGTLAFIVYAGLCLLLFNYLFTDTFTTESIVEENAVAIPTELVEEEAVNVNNDSLTISSNALNAELDSIAAAKQSIDQTLQNIDEDSTMVSTAVDSLITELEEPIVKEVIEEKEVYEANAFTITDEDGTSLTQCTTFTTIYKNNAKVKIPYNCRAYGNDLKEILAKNSKAQIVINGFYSAEENNDIGLKRAQFVKKLLTNIGIDGEQIMLNDTEKNIPFNSGIAQGGVEIKMTNLSKESDVVSTAIKKETVVKEPVKTVTTTPKPVVPSGSGPYGYKRFTSGYQADYFYGNGSFTSYINELNNYLSSNSSKKVYIYAYTDTVGNATDNYNIGKNNANTAKRLMTQNGIPSNRIVAISKGEKSSGVSGNNRGMVIIVK